MSYVDYRFIFARQIVARDFFKARYALDNRHRKLLRSNFEPQLFLQINLNLRTTSDIHNMLTETNIELN